VLIARIECAVSESPEGGPDRDKVFVVVMMMASGVWLLKASAKETALGKAGISELARRQADAPLDFSWT
jgi:hypothetical protein